MANSPQLKVDKMAKKNTKIEVQGSEITIFTSKEQDYISLTDMVRNVENGLSLIDKWLRNKNTIEFLGIWEEIYNPDFNFPEFEGIKNQVSLNCASEQHADREKKRLNGLIEKNLKKVKING